jgi:hypothetical protein
MQALALTGHYGRAVEVDACGPCHLLWFDSLEASRLRGTSMIALIRTMAAAQSVPHRPLRSDLRCLRCAGLLTTVVNRSRFGRAEQLECRQGHGAWHTYGQWLAERGFVRALTSADAAAMARTGLVRHCFNCGAAAQAGDGSACGWCGSPAVLMDVDRLVQAMDPEGATRPPAHATRGIPTAGSSSPLASVCHACGHGGGVPGELRCSQCGATRIAGDLAVALAAVESVEQALLAHERNTAPHVRARRLAALEADLPRRREVVADLERDADARRGSWPGAEDEPTLGSQATGGAVARLVLDVWAMLPRWVQAAVVAAAAAAIGWLWS